MEWRHSGSHYLKKFRVQKSAGKFPPRLFGIKTASFALIILQRAKLSTQSITHLCWCNWRTFWRKNATVRSPRRSRSCMIMPQLAGHMQPRRNWPTWASKSWSPTLFSGSGHVKLPPVPWSEKTIESSPFFIQCGHCCRRDLTGRTTFWIFFEWLAKVRAMG